MTAGRTGAALGAAPRHAGSPIGAARLRRGAVARRDRPAGAQRARGRPAPAPGRAVVPPPRRSGCGLPRRLPRVPGAPGTAR